MRKIVNGFNVCFKHFSVVEKIARLCNKIIYIEIARKKLGYFPLKYLTKWSISFVTPPFDIADVTLINHARIPDNLEPTNRTPVLDQDIYSPKTTFNSDVKNTHINHCLK